MIQNSFRWISSVSFGSFSSSYFSKIKHNIVNFQAHFHVPFVEKYFVIRRHWVGIVCKHISRATLVHNAIKKFPVSFIVSFISEFSPSTGHIFIIYNFQIFICMRYFSRQLWLSFTELMDEKMRPMPKLLLFECKLNFGRHGNCRMSYLINKKK